MVTARDIKEAVNPIEQSPNFGQSKVQPQEATEAE
jgi:hypothetical protein